MCHDVQCYGSIDIPMILNMRILVFLFRQATGSWLSPACCRGRPLAAEALP